MKRYSSTMVAAITVCSVAFACASAAMASTRQVVSAPGGTWGSAEEVPGSGQLNEDGSAMLNSVSCGSVGNCSAGGYYTDGSHHQQAFVVNETNGTWGTAKEVPGTAALNKGGIAQVSSVVCATAGNCSATGFYLDHSSRSQAFVVNETNGTWGGAKEVAAALNQGGEAQAESVSCGSAGNCSAGGFYTDSSGNEQVFLVTETNGVWHAAQEIPGTGTLNQGGQASLASVRCRSAGNCTAGGSYTDASGGSQPFVVSEVNSTWGTAEELPGIAALGPGGSGGIQALGCGSAGNCSAGGIYGDASGNDGLFVDNQTNGTWGTPQEVPGFAVNPEGEAEFWTMACASAGNCAAGGLYTPSSATEAFVVDETNGTWHTIEEVPGTAALNSGGYASTYSISCPSAGNCSAGGSYTDSFNHEQAFVVNEANGTWGGAIEVPGTVTLNQGGNAGISSLSCRSAGHCSAGGQYRDSSNLFQVFVVNET